MNAAKVKTASAGTDVRVVSRQTQYVACRDAAMVALRQNGNIFVSKGGFWNNVMRGSWAGGVTRRRARQLGRQIARSEMRAARKTGSAVAA